MKTTGPCPGWYLDHVVPLDNGGCDAVSNLQWLPWYLKASRVGKDRFERDVYDRPSKPLNPKLQPEWDRLDKEEKAR